MAQQRQKAGSSSPLPIRNLLLIIVIVSTIQTIVVSGMILCRPDIAISTIKTALAIMLAAGVILAFIASILYLKLGRKTKQARPENEITDERVVETDTLGSFEELATGIAHEINNPVAIMIEEAGWIEDLLAEEEFKDGKNLAEFKRALGQIRTQGGRCKEITQKLLSFTRNTDSRHQDVQPNEIIRETVALSEQKASDRNVVIDAHLQENLPTLRISPSELQQVMLNLLHNGLDAMEKTGGTLKISSGLERGDTTKGDHIIIKISDDGPGIPPGNLNRIFDPFFTTKPVGAGTGLGLSVCYGIVKKMGGTIEVRSVFEKGTTFTVKLPPFEARGRMTDDGGERAE
jgi:two-component system NtrC family sensor kinase